MKGIYKPVFVILTVIAVFFCIAIPIFNRKPVIVPKKPGTLTDRQEEGTYQLSDATREKIRESVVLYVGSPAALVNGIPRSISNNSQTVPIIKNKEVYVPAAFIAEALGNEALWDTGTSTMKIKSGHYTISFAAGQNKASVNKAQQLLPYPTFLHSGEVYIHLPSICEILGWDEHYFSNVIIISPRDKRVEFNTEMHIIYDLIYYLSSGKASIGLKLSVKEIRDIEKSSAYARAAIESLAEKSIISGDAKGNFNPKNGVTRPQMVKVLVNAVGIDTSALPGTPTFSDVPKNHWAYPYVEAGYREGLIKGVDSESFGINDYCTREQIAVMLTRALGVTDDMLPAGIVPDSLVRFSDRNGISSWAQKSVAFVSSNDIMKGSGKDSFDPKSTAVREQMALSIYRLINNKASIYEKINRLVKDRKIRVFLNEDELNLNIFPVTEVDANASYHDHNLVFQNNVLMAPVILLRFLDISIFENTRPNAITLMEAAPLGKYTSLSVKPRTKNAYMNLQGEDPFSDPEKYKDKLVVLPAAPMLIRNHLYVPVIEVIRLFGGEAAWDQRRHLLRIKNNSSPRFPNLRWVPHIIERTEADFEIKMALSLGGGYTNETGRVDYTAKGHTDSGEYVSLVSVKASSDRSSPYSKKTEYEVRRIFDKGSGYIYRIKSLNDRTGTGASPTSMENEEVLMTDLEYVRNKIELLARNFHASGLLKKQSDIKAGSQIADKYSIVISDRSAIAELLEIRKLPQLETLSPIYGGSSLNSAGAAHVFENFKMELLVNKKGQLMNCTISYSGYIKNEFWATQRDIKKLHNIPFHVYIEAGFCNFSKN
ncbi:MAG TPA: S-layer homology domain-containing protein [Clostridia bacterium]|nr:S-layer homology domain-containing protein [Clostridia bacterium]